MKNVFRCLCLLLLLPALSARAETAFTYQGYLEFQNAPADSTYDFQFRLFNALEEGDEIGAVQSAPGVAVAGGVFTVLLDFGEAPFSDSPRWLEIAVKPVRTAVYTVLQPRQRVGASPFAVRTLGVAPGAVDTIGLADDAVTRAKIAPDAIGTMEIQDGTVASVDIRDGAVTANDLAANAVTNNAVATGAIDSDDIADGSITADDLAANAVTNNAVAVGAIDSGNIADGSILPIDVRGGLYTRKGDLYLATSTESVSIGKSATSVSCADANDILIWAVCQPDSDNSNLRVVSERITFADIDVLPATLQCRMVNDSPTNVETYSATVACVAVP